ncbi:unnamed protein product [Prorocentrum cordatum]|uniref:Sulfotransferase n=1 Tax=Prorocentrum cordatum TaxID=2364126 RepID=A0ABN9TRR6_9DINO|nr:unnamed protein product [Polarella glacialis]
MGDRQSCPRARPRRPPLLAAAALAPAAAGRGDELAPGSAETLRSLVAELAARHDVAALAAERASGLREAVEAAPAGGARCEVGGAGAEDAERAPAWTLLGQATPWPPPLRGKGRVYKPRPRDPALPSAWRRVSGVRSPCYHAGSDGELACLPLLLNLAPPKCGTTDLYYRVLANPSVVEGEQVVALDEIEGNAVKEPKYWLHGVKHGMPVEVYAQVYLPLARAVAGPSANSTQLEGSPGPAGAGAGAHQELLSMDFSATNFCARPAALWRVLPESRFVAVLRDPVKRAESHFNFAFTMYYSAPGCHHEHSPAFLHENVVNITAAFRTCLADFGRTWCWEQQRGPDRGPCSERARSPRFVLDGLYGTSLVRFLDFYPRDRFFLRRLDELDFRRDKKTAARTLRELWAFAGISSVELPKQKRKAAHTKLRENEQTRTVFFAHLLEETRTMLREFYRPDLARLHAAFGDKSLSWW